MRKVKYSLTIHDHAKDRNPDKRQRTHHLTDIESLPRFQVGDQIDQHFFNPTTDLGWRYVVTDACYFFGGGQENPEIKLVLHIQEEPSQSHTERQNKMMEKGTKTMVLT